MKAKTNNEGLTWDEWIAAAHLGGQWDTLNNKPLGYTDAELTKLRAAWEAVEDPTEYAAARQNKS